MISKRMFNYKHLVFYIEGLVANTFDEVEKGLNEGKLIERLSKKTSQKHYFDQSESMWIIGTPTEKESRRRGTKKGVRGTGITYTRDDEDVIQGKKKKIGTIVKAKMKEQKITYRKLEETTNVYTSQLTEMTSGRGNYVIDNFLRVIDAVGLKVVLMNKDDDDNLSQNQNKLDLIISMLEEMKSE